MEAAGLLETRIITGQAFPIALAIRIILFHLDTIIGMRPMTRITLSVR